MPPEPSIEEVRRKFGGPGVSDEELVLRVYAGVDAVKALFAAGPRGEYPSATQPWALLVEELAKRRKYTHIHIEKPGFSLTLGTNESRPTGSG